MSDLNTKPNLPAPDDFYAALLDAHDGLSAENSASLNARLILILANHVGNMSVLNQAIEAAKQS
jgi:hypothetical protein